MQHDFLTAIVQELKEDYGCHTAILYGSHATGDATPTSDYDIAAFAPRADVLRVAEHRAAGYLDLFIYPETYFTSGKQEMLKLLGGRVLFELEDKGTALLAKATAHHKNGPTTLPADELAARRAWAWKMLARAEAGDTEGHYRLHWLLMALLEDYFVLRQQWFLGPKRSLKWLKLNAPADYALFDAALKPTASLKTIAELVETVTGQSPPTPQ